MDNFNTMKYLMSAGNSEEVAKELVRISYECGVPLIAAVCSINDIPKIEESIRKSNTLGYK